MYRVVVRFSDIRDIPGYFIFSADETDKPQHQITYRLTCVLKEDSNQPAQPDSLIRVFVVRMRKLCILGYPKCTQ